MDIHIWISIYGYPYMDIHIWISIYGYPYMDIRISIYGYPYMDIHIRISIYGYPYWVPRDPWGGSMDTLGGPMGLWDRWDVETDGTWASRTPDTSSEDTSSELFIDTRPGPARPGRPGPEPIVALQFCVCCTAVFCFF